MVTAGALIAPVAAHAGTYTVVSCHMGTSFATNRAWLGVNNSLSGDPTYTTPDTSCARPGDPLAARVTKVPVAFLHGVSSELVFRAPTGTHISDFDVVIRHVYNAVGQRGGDPDSMF